MPCQFRSDRSCCTRWSVQDASPVDALQRDVKEKRTIQFCNVQKVTIDQALRRLLPTTQSVNDRRGNREPSKLSHPYLSQLNLLYPLKLNSRPRRLRMMEPPVKTMVLMVLNVSNPQRDRPFAIRLRTLETKSESKRTFYNLQRAFKN